MVGSSRGLHDVLKPNFKYLTSEAFACLKKRKFGIEQGTNLDLLFYLLHFFLNLRDARSFLSSFCFSRSRRAFSVAKFSVQFRCFASS